MSCKVIFILFPTGTTRSGSCWGSSAPWRGDGGCRCCPCGWPGRRRRPSSGWPGCGSSGLSLPATPSIPSAATTSSPTTRPPPSWATGPGIWYRPSGTPPPGSGGKTAPPRGRSTDPSGAKKGRPALPGLLFLSAGRGSPPRPPLGRPADRAENRINFPSCGHPTDNFPAQDNLLLTGPGKFVIILTLII